MRWRSVGLPLMIAACASTGPAPAGPDPVLHPNLQDAQEQGFHLLAGRIPFRVQFHVENGRGYGQDWDFDGDGASDLRTGDSAPVTYVFDQPGTYLASVELSATTRQPMTLTQRFVALGERPAEARAGKYGVNEDLIWDPPGLVEPEIRLMKGAGVQWVRMPLRWFLAEPEPGRYEWAEMDEVVDEVANAGLQILAVLGGTPEWSSGVGEHDVPQGILWDAYEPSSASDFAEYVYAAVDHFRGRIDAYEIFNEPNSPDHWRPVPNAERYVEHLCAGYFAAKYADPASVVVVGGLNGNGLYVGWEPPESRDFLRAIYSGPGAHCFDVMAIHPFAHPTEDGLAGLQAWLNGTLEFMAAQGDTRELWLTEVGWSTAPNVWGHTTIDERQQADWVQVVYRDLAGPQKVFWYNLRDVGLDPANPEHHWGWLRANLEPKPAFKAFERLEK